MKAQYGTSVCGLCKEKIARGSEIEKFNNLWSHKACIDAREKKPGPEKSKEKKPYLSDAILKKIEAEEKLKNKKESLASLEDLEKAEQEKNQELKKLKVTSPMFEAEILTKYYRNISYKIVFSEVENINSVSTDQLRSMQIERNMLTKILLSTDLRLREINNIKSEYAKKN